MLEQFVSHHPVLGPLGFIAARGVAILIPWLPAFTIDLPGLLMFGLFPGFFYAEIGIILGASVAFWISRLFKHEILHFFPSLAGTHSSHTWSERQAFFAVLAMRLSMLPFFDYVAGFLNISFSHFFIATIIGSIPPTLFFYYFGTKAFDFSVWCGIAFIAATILTALGLSFLHKQTTTPGKSVEE
ncbi:MAG: TVP38/TMEM64 family protein [Candidatus Yonathbacteria bacterium]|nr:TVP38/TMEM64 family protein [Candidatus Yonathbacteria bacterium]